MLYGYNAFTLASYIVEHNLGIREQYKFLHAIYREENAFLLHKYQNNEKLLNDEIRYVINMVYLNNDYCSNTLSMPEYDENEVALHEKLMEMLSVDNVFQNIRLEIKYGLARMHKRMKLRTLLDLYGYKRRSDSIVRHMYEQMLFYHIGAFRNGEYVDIWDVPLDAMLTFKILC